MVVVNEDGVYFSGLNTGALLALSSNMEVTGTAAYRKVVTTEASPRWGVV